MLKNTVFLSMFLPATYLLSQPVEIQFETGGDTQLCFSLLYTGGYFLIFYLLFIYLSQGFWKATPTLLKMLLESLWRYKGHGLCFTCRWSRLHLSAFSLPVCSLNFTLQLLMWPWK